jgi:hypothetical protein
MIKTIKIEDVKSISLINTSENQSRILLTLQNNHSYYATGDIDIIENTYYCHYGFTCWSNI